MMTHTTFVDKNGRVCTRCDTYKLWSEFNVQRSHTSSTGYRSACKRCLNDHVPPKEKRKCDYIVNDIGRECIACKKFRKWKYYYAKKANTCKLCAAKKSKEWSKNHPGHRRDKHLEAKYGITANKYDAMFKSQNGVCAICGQPETSVDSRTSLVYPLAVDHDHKTGKTRGLLCSNCNKALGQFKDSPKILQSAIDYLRRHP